MIRIDNLTAGYDGKPVLRDFSLSLEEGKIYALIGPSGCGKTTLLQVLCGIREPERGAISFRERAWKEADVTVGYVPQNYGLLDWKTVEQNIYLPLALGRGKEKGSFGVSRSHAGPTPLSIIEALGLRDLLGRYPSEISGGQKQRVALARAFLCYPQVLLMDEPFSALDAFTSVASQRLFLSMWAQYRVTTLFITHNIHEAAAVGQHILLMDKDSHNIVEHFENTSFGQGDAAASAKMALEIGERFSGVVEC